MTKPPSAKRVEHVVHRSTGDVGDDWAWLREKDDPDTVGYLEAENAYADKWFEPLAGVREDIFEEIRGRVVETDLSVPVRKGEWVYFSRTVEGLEYPIHCRRGLAADSIEHVLIDENVEAGPDTDYFAVGAFEISPSGRLLAWSSDRDGSEQYELRLRDLTAGRDGDDVIAKTCPEVAWSTDERHLFYVRPDDAMRPFQIWRHELGTDPSTDVLVYEDLDERFYLELERSRSGAFIIISSSCRTMSEALVIPADEPKAAPRSIAGRTPGHEYSLDHRGDEFFILTNLDAVDFRVVTAPLRGTAGPETWRPVVEHEAGRRISQIECFAGHVVLFEWSDAQPQIRVLFDDGTERVLAFDEEVHGVDLGANPEFDCEVVRFDYESLTSPPAVYDEDVHTGERTLLKQTPVPGYDPSRYVSTRLWAKAPDATLVPIDVVRHVDTPLDGSAALLLLAYGAYEVSIPPYFSVARPSLLDRGVVFALAHPRGGGELGRGWYLGGKMANKVNTFTDTISCAEHLIAAGFAAPNRVVLRGGSAGGLMVGACVTMRPDLWGAAVAEVPFVDVLNTMSDPTLPLTINEWEEWGNPAIPEQEAWIARYSPYDNVEPAEYPPLYVTTGLNDPRVSYHEPAKWVAKLRATGTGDTLILLRTEMGAGHGGPSGRYDSWRDEARTMSFILRTVSRQPIS